MRVAVPHLSLLFLLIVYLVAPVKAQPPGGDDLWFSRPPELPAVHLYFFWSESCPHCREARPFIESLPERHSWLRVHSLELMEHPENLARFRQIAGVVGFEPSSVPTLVWCGRHHTGYRDAETTGESLVAALSACYRDHYGVRPPGFAGDSTAEGEDRHRDPPGIPLPWLGEFDPDRFSMASLAVILGGLDAFNPCAFFVLLFLLSLLVNTRDRRRMALVGGLFVAVSGVVYFAFMAAWLNLFQLLGGIALVTSVAGVVALFIGFINIRDYVRRGEGVSLGISEGQRKRLFARMRALLDSGNLPALLTGTLLLAVAANSYELLCTMGLPMVFTRILTLEQLPVLHYYLYLALYNLVYVLPLAVIVGLFVGTMGRRKLSESEGWFLRLLSGCMMAALGLLLLLSPERLSEPLVAVTLMAAALGLTVLVHGLHERRKRAASR